MKLFNYIDKSLLNEMVSSGYINVTKHPIHNLYIYNYTQKCTFDKMWNDATEKCRGLIVDENNTIVSRPFRKFYNLEELDESVIPNLPFNVYDKLDGSLGILYWYKDTPYISTRGSFTSDQALHATEVLHKRYNHIFNLLDKQYTYLFEIIYPGDLHVVSYDGLDDIVLLAIIDNETGEDKDIYSMSDYFRCTKMYDGIKDWRQLRDMFAYDGQEGYVIRFSNGYRLKLKYAEYFRLHFLMTGFTENRVFECLRDNDMDTINEAMDMFDEEHKIVYQAYIDKYTKWYNDIYALCEKEYRDDFETQKDAALYFNTCTYPAVLFGMRSGKDIKRIIWKIIDKER